MPNKGGYSWKTFFGITKVKQNISRKTGVPLTKSGRQWKIGAMISKNCCCCSTISYGFLFILLILLIIFLVVS
jgi:hypothetical protein